MSSLEGLHINRVVTVWNKKFILNPDGVAPLKSNHPSAKYTSLKQPGFEMRVYFFGEQSVRDSVS